MSSAATPSGPVASPSSPIDQPTTRAKRTLSFSQHATDSEKSIGIPIRRLTSLEPSLAGPLTRYFSQTLPNPSPSPEPNPYPGSGTLEDPYLVDWLPDEPANPYNWKNSFKWTLTLLIAISTLCIAFASSSYSSAIGDIMLTFPGTSQELGIGGISLYVLGFGCGPLVWAPLSEMMGRRFAFVASFPLFALFNMAGALAQNIQTLLIVRFLAGTFGSAPLTNAGGQISDMWAAHERAMATSLFALAPFLGPVLGPIVGGFVSESAGWRWVFWVQFIFAAVMLVLSTVFVPETYAPTLLRRKAASLQKEADAAGTGEHFIAKYDRVKKTTGQVIKIGLARPFQLLFQETIVFCLSVYVAIIYGTLYLFFTAFPIVFVQTRGWSIGMSGLAFIGIGVGLVIGNFLNPIGNVFYRRAAAIAGPGQRVPPEARLPMACVGAVLLPIGLFWFAWTSQASVHWIVPILASVPFGCGFLLIFTGVTMYLMDSYQLFAASALAANAVMRSVFGAIFPLFSTYLYRNLGLNWAGTLVAFLSLICTPMPFLFYYYGPALRARSRYAPSTPVKTVNPESASPSETATAVDIPVGNETERSAVVERKLSRKITIREDEALEPEYGIDAGEHSHGDRPVQESEKSNV